MKIKVKLQRPGYPTLEHRVVEIEVHNEDVEYLEKLGYFISDVELK